MRKLRPKRTTATGPAGFFRVFTYRVTPAQRPLFRKTYGPAGPWACLFAQADGYLGTNLLQRSGSVNEFMTIDTWKSESAWSAFVAAHGQRYAQMSRDCQRLYRVESEIGSFGSL